MRRSRPSCGANAAARSPPSPASTPRCAAPSPARVPSPPNIYRGFACIPASPLSVCVLLSVFFPGIIVRCRVCWFPAAVAASALPRAFRRFRRCRLYGVVWRAVIQRRVYIGSRRRRHARTLYATDPSPSTSPLPLFPPSPSSLPLSMLWSALTFYQRGVMFYMHVSAPAATNPSCVLKEFTQDGLLPSDSGIPDEQAMEAVRGTGEPVSVGFGDLFERRPQRAPGGAEVGAAA